MAWLEKRGDMYHIGFFHGGKHYSRSLKTSQSARPRAPSFGSKKISRMSSDNYSSPATTTIIPDLPSTDPTSTTITFPDRLAN